MLDATIILQILWTSLATSSYYVLFAVAFALVLKVTGLFNFAQAAIMTVAFYTAYRGGAVDAMASVGGFRHHDGGHSRRLLCPGAHRV